MVPFDHLVRILEELDFMAHLSASKLKAIGNLIKLKFRQMVLLYNKSIYVDFIKEMFQKLITNSTFVFYRAELIANQQQKIQQLCYYFDGQLVFVPIAK